MGRYKTAVITTLDDVPAGYVQLTKLSALKDGTQDRTLHKALSEAHGQGVLPAVKLFRSANDWKTGPVFLEQGAAEKFIAEWRAVREPKPVVADEPPATARTTLSPPFDQVEQLRSAIVALRIEVAALSNIIRELRVDAVKPLSVDIRNLQAAVELRAEVESETVAV